MDSWRPLGDEPLDDKQCRQLDAGRLQPTVASLTTYFSAWLWPRPGQTLPPQCIGLFGGLGQGKSSAVRASLERTRPDASALPRLRRLLTGDPIQTFNVSQFGADDLEWRLMAAVLLRRSFSNLMLWLMILVVVMLIVGTTLQSYFGDKWTASFAHWAMPGVKALIPAWLQEVFKQTASPLGGVVAWTSLGVVIGFFLRRLVTQPIHQRVRDVGIIRLARWTRAVPRLLIVDDLDRADVKQQRAFLRALHKWNSTDRLGWSVLVCMDDTALMQSPSAPEAPEALILKCLHAVLRLPDRQREDVVTLVLACTQQACTANRSFQPLLCHVQWLASMVRVLLGAYRPSAIGPRLVKHVLNDVMVHGSTLLPGHWPCASGKPSSDSDLDDWCALLRLDGLLRILPELRHDMPGVIKALEANTEPEFARLFDVKRFDLQDRRRMDGLEFLLATRMLQPGHREGWFGLLVNGRRDDTASSSLGRGVPPIPTNPASAVEPTVNGDIYRYTQLYSALIDLGRLGHSRIHDLHPQPRPLRSFAGRPPRFERTGLNFDHAGFLATVAVRRSDDGSDQDGLPAEWIDEAGGSRSAAAHLHEWLCWVAVIATTESSQRAEVLLQLPDWTSALSSSPAFKTLRRLAATERVAHSEYWQRLTAAQRLDVLRDAGGDTRAIGLVPMDHAQLDAVLDHLIRQPALDARKALRLLAPWGRRATLEKFGESSTRIGLDDPTGVNRQVLALVWPSPVRAGASALDWAEALRGPIGAVLYRLGWEGVVPESWLHGWRKAAASVLTTTDCLQLLASVACLDTSHPDHGDWREDALAPWLDVPGRWPPSLEKLSEPVEAWSGRTVGIESVHLLAAALVCGFLGWNPAPALIARIEERASAVDVAKMLLALVRLGNRRPTLLPEWHANGILVRCLRLARDGFTAADAASTVTGLREQLGTDHANDLLRTAAWPPADDLTAAMEV